MIHVKQSIIYSATWAYEIVLEITNDNIETRNLYSRAYFILKEEEGEINSFLNSISHTCVVKKYLKMAFNRTNTKGLCRTWKVMVAMYK